LHHLVRQQNCVQSVVQRTLVSLSTSLIACVLPVCSCVLLAVWRSVLRARKCVHCCVVIISIPSRASTSGYALRRSAPPVNSKLNFERGSGRDRSAAVTRCHVHVALLRCGRMALGCGRARVRLACLPLLGCSIDSVLSIVCVYCAASVSCSVSRFSFCSRCLHSLSSESAV
jgi:hypothetical protein